MSKKQIEEMKQVLVEYCVRKNLCFSFETLRKYSEVLYNAGYRKQSDNTVELPCNVGDTVYAAITPIDGVDIEIDLCIEEWEVKGVCLEGDKWYAENSDGEFFEIGTDLCKLTRQEAEQTLAKMKGGE